MNISSEIFPTDRANISDDFFYSGTGMETVVLVTSVVYIIVILLVFSLNSYVIWLIVTGAGNGLTAELFSLNICVCDMFLCMGIFLHLISINFEIFLEPLSFLEELAFTGHPLFQCLMCFERYLAVVHPVTFLKFKPLRYRLLGSVIVWVACFMYGGINITIFHFLLTYINFIFSLAQFSLFFCIQLFCLVAVLRALMQSGPGERKRMKEENHLKRRAFYIILITTVTTLILFYPYMILVILSKLVDNVYISLQVGFIFFLMAGLVQPLLFLYQVGTPPFIRCQ